MGKNAPAINEGRITAMSSPRSPTLTLRCVRSEWNSLLEISISF
jgi:hypothetical protein